MTGHWSKAHIVKFVTLYRENENFWNCFTQDYKTRDIRKVSLQQIAREMGIPDFG